jgi:hypothetical protein
MSNPVLAAGGAAASAAAPAALACHMVVKLQDSEFRFARADSVFRSAYITHSLTKYDHCLAKPSSSVLPAIRELQ